jgi:predicted phage gp36 major capsid-like protein
VVTRKRRTIEEMIAETEARLKLLKEKKSTKKQKVKAVKLTKETAGMTELVNQINAIADANGAKTADVIMAASKMLRTGLVIKHRSQEPKFDDVMGM